MEENSSFACSLFASACCKSGYWGMEFICKALLGAREEV